MRILVVSEGKNELSTPEDEGNQAALQTLVRRLLNDPKIECRLESIRHPEFGHVHKGKGGRFLKRAIRCMDCARGWGCDALVIVIDQDGDPDREPQFHEAQLYAGDSLPRALVVAVKSFDAWMLADEQALSIALGATIQRQPDPEHIKDPKAHCKELRARNGHGPGLTEMYKSIAGTADLVLIEKRCPSFSVFADRVRGLIA